MQELPDAWGPHEVVVRVQAGPRYEPQDLPGTSRALAQAAAQRASAAGAEVASIVGPEELLFVLDCTSSQAPGACLEAALDALVDAGPAASPDWPSLKELDVIEAWWSWAWQGHGYARTASPLQGTVGVFEPARVATLQREAWSRSRWHVHHGASLSAEAVSAVLARLPANLGPDEALMRPLASEVSPQLMHLPRSTPAVVVTGHVGLDRDLTLPQRRSLWELWACAHPDATPLEDLGSWALLRATDPVWLGLPSSTGEVTADDPSGVSCGPQQVVGRAARLVPAAGGPGAGIPEARRLLQASSRWVLRAGGPLPPDDEARTWPGTGEPSADGATAE